MWVPPGDDHSPASGALVPWWVATSGRIASQQPVTSHWRPAAALATAGSRQAAILNTRSAPLSFG